MWLEASARIKDKNTMVLSFVASHLFFEETATGLPRVFQREDIRRQLQRSGNQEVSRGSWTVLRCYRGSENSIPLVCWVLRSPQALIGGTSPLIVRGFVKMGPFFGMSGNLNFNPNVTHQTLDFSVFHLSPPTTQL